MCSLFDESPSLISDVFFRNNFSFDSLFDLKRENKLYSAILKAAFFDLYCWSALEKADSSFCDSFLGAENCIDDSG
jgi:hypothetical protein